MIKAKQMQDGGVHVVYVNGMMDCIHTKIISPTIAEATLDASAGEPESEATVMMTAANFHFAVGFLERGAAEFGCPHD